MQWIYWLILEKSGASGKEGSHSPDDPVRTDFLSLHLSALLSLSQCYLGLDPGAPRLHASLVISNRKTRIYINRPSGIRLSYPFWSDLNTDGLCQSDSILELRMKLVPHKPWLFRVLFGKGRLNALDCEESTVAPPFAEATPLLKKTFYFVLGYSQLTYCDSFRRTVKELSHTYACIHSPPKSPPIQAAT